MHEIFRAYIGKGKEKCYRILRDTNDQSPFKKVNCYENPAKRVVCQFHRVNTWYIDGGTAKILDAIYKVIGSN